MQPTTQVSQETYNNLADWAKPSYSVQPTPQTSSMGIPSTMPINAPKTMSPSSMSMTPESLQSTPLVKVPKVTPTTPTDLTSTTQPDYGVALANAEKAQAVVGTQAQDAQSALTKLAENIFGQKATIQESQTNLEKQAGLDEQQKALNQVNTEIANEQVAMRAEEEKIRQGYGTEAQKAISRNTINDTYGRRLQRFRCH